MTPQRYRESSFYGKFIVPGGGKILVRGATHNVQHLVDSVVAPRDCATEEKGRFVVGCREA